MALKFKITKSAFAKLSEDMQKEYTEDDDGKNYTLDVSGLPAPEDNGELKRAKDREKERADNLQEELDEATTELTKIKEGQGKDERDVARVKERAERKLVARETELNEVIDGLKGHITRSMKEAAAASLATKISTVPKLMQKHVEERLLVEFDADNQPSLKVLKDGKASDLTTDKLGEELVANKDFAAIIVGSKAKGGGASLNTTVPPGGSAPNEKPADLSKASAADLAAHVKQVIAAKATA